MLKTLQNFYKATISRAWAVGTGNRYVSSLPTPSAGYLVVNPSNITKREIVEYSGKGTDGNGNYVTLITRGVGGTTEQTHSVNEPVRMNITAEHYAEVQDEFDDFQEQIDTLVLQNAPNSSTSAKGIGKLSVAPVDADEPIFVGDNDPRITGTPEDFIDSSAGAGDAGKGVKLNASGKIGNSMLNGYGDGSDGDYTVSSPETLTRDMYYDNLTVNDTLTTAGYRIFVKNTLSGTGTIDNSGANGGNGGNGGTNIVGTAGTAGASTGTGIFKTVAGKVGGASTNNQGGAGTTGTTGTLAPLGSAGGRGGDADHSSYGAYSAGGAGGAGTNTQILAFGQETWLTTSVLDLKTDGDLTLRTKIGSGSGSAGGSRGYSSGNFHGGGGGGSGASGGVVWIACRTFAGSFTIKATGGNGGNGGDASSQAGVGGGGGGGAGGVAIIIFDTKTWTGSYNLVGGTAGAKGSGVTTNSTNATAGINGIYYEIN